MMTNNQNIPENQNNKKIMSSIANIRQSLIYQIVASSFTGLIWGEDIDDKQFDVTNAQLKKRKQVVGPHSSNSEKAAL